MFVVVQKGIYRHSIWGVCNTIEDAKKLAERQILEEEDDYHTADIVEFDEVNQRELEVVASLTRKDNCRYEWTNSVMKRVFNGESKLEWMSI